MTIFCNADRQTYMAVTLMNKIAVLLAGYKHSTFLSKIVYCNFIDIELLFQ